MAELSCRGATRRLSFRFTGNKRTGQRSIVHSIGGHSLLETFPELLRRTWLFRCTYQRKTKVDSIGVVIYRDIFTLNCSIGSTVVIVAEGDTHGGRAVSVKLVSARFTCPIIQQTSLHGNAAVSRNPHNSSGF